MLFIGVNCICLDDQEEDKSHSELDEQQKHCFGHRNTVNDVYHEDQSLQGKFN